MSNLRIKHPTKQLTGNITLPASKSICNRVLLLQKVLGVNTKIQNISTADDSVIMQLALQQNNGTVDVKNANLTNVFTIVVHWFDAKCQKKKEHKFEITRSSDKTAEFIKDQARFFLVSEGYSDYSEFVTTTATAGSKKIQAISYETSERAYKITLVVDTVDELKALQDKYKDICGTSLVTDAGYTVFNEPTTTGLGLGPIAEENIGDDIKSLKTFT